MSSLESNMTKMHLFELFYTLVQKHHLKAKNQFNPTGLTPEKCWCFFESIKPVILNWFKLHKQAFKLFYICLNGLFHNWFKLLVATGLNQFNAPIYKRRKLNYFLYLKKSQL